MADCSTGKDGHDHLVNLLLIGDSGVGKSSLLSRFTRGKFRPDPKPTSTNNIVARHVYVDGKIIKAQILDINGNRSYTDISTELLSANGALIVYDVTSLSTFKNAEQWYKELQIANGKIEVMLIGNKSDLMNDSVTTTAIAGKEFALRESLGFIETSAMDNINVEKAFVEVVTRIFQKLFKNDIMYAVSSSSTVFPAISSEAWTSRYSGKNEPAHYMLKIESFSLLCEAETNKFESDVFEASGYKWRLELYPNGNEESRGNHISIYVTICDAESLPKGWEAWLDGKFCVYDHMQQNYITFQGKRTRFHEKKMRWGFSRLMSLAFFTDARNGFVFQDSCVFGAELLAVPKYATKDQCLSVIKPPPVINTHTWTIESFSTITEKVLLSDDFKIGKVKWQLALYPKGNRAGGHTSLAIYLRVHPSVWLLAASKVYANYNFQIKNQGSYADIEGGCDSWLDKSDTGYGYSNFIPLSELCDPENSFLLDDVLIVEAEFSVVGMLKDFN